MAECVKLASKSRLKSTESTECQQLMYNDVGYILVNSLLRSVLQFGTLEPQYHFSHSNANLQWSSMRSCRIFSG